MKKFIAMILFFASFSAFAALSPKDVVREVHQGHWQKADQMLSEIVQQHPNSAKAWYYKAQVDAHLQNAQLASQELSKAVNLEPSMHFASSSSEVSQLQKQIQFELQNRSSSSVTHASYQQNSHSHSHFLAWLGGFIIVLAIGITIFVIWSNRKKNAEMEQQKRQYLSQLVDAQSNLMQLQKDIHYSSKEKTQLAQDVETMLAAANDEIKYIRQSNQWDNHISSYEYILSSVKILQSNFKQEKFDASLEEIQESKQDRNVPYQNEMSQQGSFGGSSSGYQPQQTVVVQNSNDGFFNGLLMGELMSGSNRPQENIVINNIDNNSSSSDNWDNSSQNDFDSSSNNDSSWSDSSNDSSSFDSGSSDNSWDDSSSFDSSSDDSSSW